MQSSFQKDKVMPAPPENSNPIYWKFAIYVFSAMIGLGARLAVYNAKEKLTFKELARNVAITALATWLVWNVCVMYDISNNATYIYGALAAKFSDSVVLLAWQTFKNAINKWDA